MPDAKQMERGGRAKLMKGDKNGSVEDLKKALELNPEGEEAQKINGKFSNFEDMYSNRIL